MRLSIIRQPPTHGLTKKERRKGERVELVKVGVIGLREREMGMWKKEKKEKKEKEREKERGREWVIVVMLLGIMYGVMGRVVYRRIHMMDVAVDVNNNANNKLLFSEETAVEHVRYLSSLSRQEGRPGLSQAAQYIHSALLSLKSNNLQQQHHLRIEVEHNLVNGSFNMIFLGHSISLSYRSHPNILARFSSPDSTHADPSLLINAHFDSPLASPGAADCASCVASMLEVARVLVHSAWIPPRPIIFLFNGAEELFMLGSHGFMTTHRWRHSIGASINVEASGSGGPDLVCQSGPGSWPSLVYAQSAVYPMAHSAAQDAFHLIPGDTDYRMFSQDYGNIPSLDIIFLLGGYYYHTSYDTVDKLLPGSMQARGENLLSLLKAFSNSSKLLTAQERESLESTANFTKDERAIFFDYLSWFMVYYSSRVAMVLHSVPVVIFLAVPFFLQYLGSSLFAAFYDLFKGMVFHALGIVLGVVLPIIFSIVRLLFSSYSMNWFAHPHLAFMMFIPSSLIGLLIPNTLWGGFCLSQDVSVLNKSKEAALDGAMFWGAFGFYAFLTMAYLVAGLSGGFLTFTVSVFMLPAWMLFSLSAKSWGRQSLRSAFFYVAPLIPCLTYSVYFGGFLIEFLIEKMGMMGSIPPPFGYFVPDVVVAAVIGVVTGWCVGPLIPICSRWIARSSILQFLFHVTVMALALSSQFFPYSNTAPKRLVFQHTFITTDGNTVVDTSYEFSVVDSNSLPFLFKHAREVAKELQIGPDFSYENATMSRRENWMALFPVSFLFSRSLKFQGSGDDILKRYSSFPHLTTYKEDSILADGSRRVHLELVLGDLEEVWVTVLNITGPLSSWSFADNKLPAAEVVDNGPPSYISRLSGASHEKWRFWLEAVNKEEQLRVEVAVVDQVLGEEASKLKGLFPDWVDVTAYSSFMSTYLF